MDLRPAPAQRRYDTFAVERAPSDSGSTYFVDPTARPATAPGPRFQKRGVGGGGGGGGGHGGLGGRHAPKDIKEVLPRKLHGVADEATRCVASRPPRPRPPSAGAYKEQAAPPTIFKVVYDRGDLPIRVNGGVAKYVRWAVRDVPAPDRASALSSAGALGGPEYEAARTRFLRALDYNVMLPLFFDGLREESEPCRFLAATGMAELLAPAHADAARVGPVLPLLILPLRQALNTRKIDTVRRAITALQQLVKVPGTDPASGQTVGALLAPYFRHILPVFNLFKSRSSLATSGSDYSISIGELMDETMHLLALHGGTEAAHEIHRLVPLWMPPPPPPRPPTAAQQGRVLAQAGCHRPEPTKRYTRQPSTQLLVIR